MSLAPHEPDTAAADPAQPRPSRRGLRPLTIGVLGVVAASAVAGSLVTSRVVSDQEHRLLKQRTDEAALYLTGALTSVTGTLSSLAASAAAVGDSPTAFSNAALPMTKAKGGFQSLVLVRATPTPHVVASAGEALPALDGPRLAALSGARRGAVFTGATVATELFDGGAGVRRVGFAYAAPASDYEVYAETQVHPDQPSPTTAGAPFSELIAAVYAVPRVQADQLVLYSEGAGKLPLSGHTASAISTVGGQKWLLVARARHALVGSVANATPWGLLVAGLLAAVLAGAVVETLSRRRDYATAVADERTAELKQSLEDLAAAHEQLVRQERLAAIGELASTIGHELRNPLGVISNAHYLLRNDISKFGEGTSRDTADRHLSTAEREVSAATVIVSDLLEFARQRDPVLVDFDAGTLLDEVLTVLPPPTGIQVERVPDASPVHVAGDRDMLRQVLLNLVGNAYQAMPEGGRVRLSLAESQGMVQVQVTDNGVGMTSEVRDKLFQPFFTTKARGVGLGLAVSRRIIDAHHGTISVESEPGQGTTFVVSLPQVRVPRQVAIEDSLSVVSEATP